MFDFVVLYWSVQCTLDAFKLMYTLFYASGTLIDANSLFIIVILEHGWSFALPRSFRISSM